MNSLYLSFEIGDVVSTPKFPGIEHLGIVVGFNIIAHSSPTQGIVTSSIQEFAQNSIINFKRKIKNPARAVNKALQLVNRKIPYNLLSGNCEHFVSHCESDFKPTSPQLKTYLFWSCLIVAFIFAVRSSKA